MSRARANKLESFNPRQGENRVAARFVCYGELLLRLGAPARELLLQQPRFELHHGGAEANVAVALARWGHEAAVVSVVPDNALGSACVGELRRHGVDTRAVSFGPGRMGLYFLATGAGHRPSEVLYDRAGSAFALTGSEQYDWRRLLHGATHLHLSGVTPALGPGPAEAAVGAARAARALGLNVSFDGNYRAKLWQAWDGDAPAILRRLFECADTAFADHRDIATVLQLGFDGTATDRLNRQAAQAAFEAFPQLQRIATTVRVQHSVDRHELSALMVRRQGAITTEAYEVTAIVDRIGAGDAFAAGVLHGLASGLDDNESLRFGLASA
jgi:2-dehydro-3-deoxygluconokinase